MGGMRRIEPSLLPCYEGYEAHRALPTSVINVRNEAQRALPASMINVRNDAQSYPVCLGELEESC